MNSVFLCICYLLIHYIATIASSFVGTDFAKNQNKYIHLHESFNRNMIYFYFTYPYLRNNQ